jgi:hypothetical protein
MELDRNSVKPGVYRHFKGNIYHVLGVGENTETGELTVFCIPQHGSHAGKLSNRKLEMFLERVSGHKDRPDYTGPRFELLEERDFIIRS